VFRWTKYWIDNYGSSGIPDQRAVQDFMDCETRELVDGLRNELVGLVQGAVTEEVLDQIVGQKRKGQYGSYVEWGKLMLLWMASYKA